jgi:peptidoglycan/LPS O-acetylase OafA/YrhL
MSSQRIPSLDGLRAISIALVLFSHWVSWSRLSPQLVQSYGKLGVHVFFVISGYLITSLLLREHERTSTISLRDFYVRRAFRIFPAAFVFLAIVVVLFWPLMRWYHVAAAVLYVANMDGSRPWIFGHLWSLSIEEQFYLLWPWAVKKWYRIRTPILLCVLLGAPLFRVALYAFKTQNGLLLGSLPIRADQLAVGCLLAIFAPRLPKISGYLALAMAVVVALVPAFPASSSGRTLLMLFVLRPLLHISIAGCVLHVMQVPYRILNYSPIVWFGKISYSIYLWQELFIPSSPLGLGYAGLPATIACACLSYYLVEQPFLRFREVRVRSRQTRVCPEIAEPIAAVKLTVSQFPRKQSPDVENYFSEAL